MKPANPRPARAAIVATLFSLLSVAGASAADCNGNGVDDAADIAAGTSLDCNTDGRPDECEFESGTITFDETRVVLGSDEGYVFHWTQADLDGDGDLDLATAKERVAIVFNRGDGVFGAPEFAAEEIEISGGAWNEVLGEDLDGDGDIDLALSSQHRAEAAILGNDGSGRFTVTQVAALPGESAGIQSADLDLDGDLDLVLLAVSYRFGLRIYDTLALLRNRGDGSFDVELVDATAGVPTHSGAWTYPSEPLLVDVDGNGFPDIVSRYRIREEAGERDYLDGGIIVRLNAGDGTFPTSASTSLGPSPFTNLVGQDLDGDGDIDLALASPEKDTVSLLRNPGDGSFDRPVEVPAGGPVNRLVVADLDADGDPDLIAWERGTFDGDAFGTAILSNDGNGHFGPPELLPLANVHRLEVVDLDTDGLPDIVATFYLYDDAHIEIRRNLGGNAFGEAGRFQLANEAYGIDAADLDGDRDPDLVVSGPMQVLRNVTGDESFGSGCSEFVRGDANADGNVSLADSVTITRFPHDLLCRDAADANDDERADFCDATLLSRALVIGDVVALPAPHPLPGSDPTPEPVENELTFAGRLGCMDIAPSARMGCAEYRVEPPRAVNDTVRIGDVFALPGREVLIPIFVTISEPVEGIQLVLEFDPEMLDFGRPNSPWAQTFDFEGSFYGQFPPDPAGWPVPNLYSFSADPEVGLAVLGIVGSFWNDGYDIPPGESILVASLRATVSPDVAPGTLIPIEPTNGPDGNGVGPYGLRNELIHRGNARFVSMLPTLEGGLMEIVGDQSYFIRGDSNGDWNVDIADSTYTLGALFRGREPLACPDAADSNDDGNVDLSDAVSALRFLFAGGERIPAPFPLPGPDPTGDGLRCLRLPAPR